MLNISSFTGGIAATNAYLLQSEHGSIVVDAPEGAHAWLQHLNVRVDAVLLTHQHFDHVMDAAAIKEAHGCKLYAFATHSISLTLEDLFAARTGIGTHVPPYAVDEVLKGRTEVTVAGIAFALLHVPGHSTDSLCFYSANEGLLLAGDVLFNGSIGRTDFPGGSMEQLLSGIEEKVLTLADETRVLPGHGDETTIGEERVGNPFLLDR